MRGGRSIPLDRCLVRRGVAIVAVACLLALAAACGGGSPSTTPAPPTATTAPSPPAVAATSPTAAPTPTAPSATAAVVASPTPAATAPPPTPAAPQAPTPAANPGGEPSATFEVAFPNLPRLERPVVMVEVPGQQRMLVALQEGRILSFPKDPRAATTKVVLDQRQKTLRQGNEEGLLGLVLDPAFPQNGYVYVYYSAADPRRSVLARLEARGSGEDLTIDPQSELVLLEVPQPYPNHNGGQLAFGPDGMLYVALGDGGSAGDPHGHGQNRQTLLGSILRIDVRNATREQPYTVPPDNPFVGASDGSRPEIWAYGLRNPWRFSFDRQTGHLWAGDVGQNAREEVDLIEKGGNYGWNIMEGTACFRPRTGCSREGLTLPVVDYPRASGHCSVIGGYVYRGRSVPALFGQYLYADFCSGAVWALDAEAAARGDDPHVVTLREEGPPISSFAEDLDGELYLLSFDGRIYRMAP